jgi:methylmalonyl-CoA/ethylmalonyl-CoA epimerase
VDNPENKTMMIDHIGVAVKNIEEAINIYEKILDTPCYKREIVESQKVETAFFRTGDSKVELLGATSPDSVIHSFIEKRGQGIHHIAFEVGDIEKEMNRLRDNGFTFINDEPLPGADNKRICFLHPKGSHGVLIELCESIKAP